MLVREMRDTLRGSEDGLCSVISCGCSMCCLITTPCLLCCMSLPQYGDQRPRACMRPACCYLVLHSVQRAARTAHALSLAVA